MRLEAGTRLGHYEVVGEIGSGGMGEVYKAKDSKLGRDVAIKVLPAETASDDQRLRRFEQEARAASALNHPNIVTIYEIGEHEGTPYIAMEYVEGRTLRDMLRGEPLPAKKLLRLAAQMADGLAKAHAAGIVHRDLKPENVMVTRDGLVKILDFGLAKLSADASPEARTVTKATEEGAVLGTVQYMSPEQAAGRPVDFRSDLFSFGSILYEMATGAIAFRRKTGPETQAAIMRDEPDPITILNPGAPRQLVNIIRRCLEKEPDERYDSTRDLARELESVGETSVTRPSSRRFLLVVAAGMGLLAMLVALAAVLTGSVGDWLTGDETRARFESLAVLPLENLSGDPEQEYFADGMTDELISELAQIESLRVISRTSIMQYKDARKPLPEIGRELDVDVVVEGTVRRAEGRVRITAQLIEAATDRHLWAQSFERELHDVLALQSEVARAIASEVQATVTPEEQLRLAASRAVDPEAHEAYLKGRLYFERLSVEDLEKSIDSLESAIAIDPSYAEAYAALAHSYSLEPVMYMIAPADGYARAKRFAEKALSLDETLEDAYLALAWTLATYDRDWRGSEDTFRRAIEFAPSSALAHARYGWFLSWLGRFDDSVREHELALKLDPLSAYVGQAFAASLIQARRYDDAVEVSKRVLELHPNYVFGYRRLGSAYTLKHMYPEALEAYAHVGALTDNPIQAWRVALIYALMGRVEEARPLLEKLVETGRAPFPVANIYVALGEHDTALLYLEDAYAKHDPNISLLKVQPSLDPIRDEPRFRALVSKMNFPD